MKKTQKGFIAPILIAIIAVLVLGGGIYLYTQNKNVQNSQDTNPQNVDQNNDQNVGLKTYVKYGFQVTYPSDFVASEQATGNSNDVVVNFSKSGSLASMSISVDNNYLKNKSTYPKGEAVTINGLSATHSGGLNPDGRNVYSEYYIFVKNNTAYSVHIGQDISLGDSLQINVIDSMTKIVRSFKFI